jgi:hypothetical protein
MGEVWAWGGAGVPSRSFLDVEPVVARIKEDDDYLGKGWTERGLGDAISGGWDKLEYNDIVVLEQIRNRVWRRGEGDARKVLYVFANLANSAAVVAFLYGRGLEGVTQSAPWVRTVNVFGPGVPAPKPARVGCGAKEEALTIPARGCAPVDIRT